MNLSVRLMNALNDELGDPPRFFAAVAGGPQLHAGSGQAWESRSPALSQSVRRLEERTEAASTQRAPPANLMPDRLRASSS